MRQVGDLPKEIAAPTLHSAVKICVAACTSMAKNAWTMTAWPLNTPTINIKDKSKLADGKVILILFT